LKTSHGAKWLLLGEENHSTIEPERNATFGEEDEHIKYFDKLKASFVDKGIPVIMGEYGCLQEQWVSQCSKRYGKA